MIVFCSDSLDPGQPDAAWTAEVAAARAAGMTIALMHWEALVEDNDARAAVRRVPRQPDVQAIYRGWMLPPDRYAALHRALHDRGIELINDPAAYTHCHYLPESYPIIESYTPRSVWLPAPVAVADAVALAASVFGVRPIVIKDYVKSRKHEWDEACFIPDASDSAAAAQVVACFVDRQGDDLAGGLVMREFVDLATLGRHPVSDMPLSVEYRIFVHDGDPLITLPYWGEITYDRAPPPLDSFADVLGAVQSRLFSADIALRSDGQWIIVELGDGQVAGLPEASDPRNFYTALARALTRSPAP